MSTTTLSQLSSNCAPNQPTLLIDDLPPAPRRIGRYFRQLTRPAQRSRRSWALSCTSVGTRPARWTPLRSQCCALRCARLWCVPRAGGGPAITHDGGVLPAQLCAGCDWFLQPIERVALLLPSAECKPRILRAVLSPRQAEGPLRDSAERHAQLRTYVNRVQNDWFEGGSAEGSAGTSASTAAGNGPARPARARTARKPPPARMPARPSSQSALLYVLP